MVFSVLSGYVYDPPDIENTFIMLSCIFKVNLYNHGGYEYAVNA